jgi:hypothetical protein
MVAGKKQSVGYLDASGAEAETSSSRGVSALDFTHLPDNRGPEERGARETGAWPQRQPEDARASESNFKQGVTVIVVRPTRREFGHEPSPKRQLCRDYPSADTACL